jgi:hypothetical protein
MSGLIPGKGKRGPGAGNLQGFQASINPIPSAVLLNLLLQIHNGEDGWQD